jgi:hypothetical protein
MAHFLYLGEPPRPWVKSYGVVSEFNVPQKDGTMLNLPAPDPQVGWKPGDDIGDITDERALRVLRVDPRFSEVK